MHTILADEHFTRRRTAHFVLDADGLVLFSASQFVECLEYLVDNGEHSARVKNDKLEFGIDIAPI